jgi:predicted  nucleic acid-binding Zn-ribbon protein
VAGGEITQLRARGDDLTRQLERMNSERRAALSQKDDLQRSSEEARRNLHEEERRREKAESEVERLKTSLLSAERISRKTTDEIAAQVYEYLSSHRGEIDPLQCAGELKVSEREIMEGLDFLQRQRKIERA